MIRSANLQQVLRACSMNGFDTLVVAGGVSMLPRQDIDGLGSKGLRGCREHPLSAYMSGDLLL